MIRKGGLDMIRTIILSAYVVLYLLLSIPRLKRVSRLEEKGEKEEKDAIIRKTAKDWADGIVRLSGSKVEVKGADNIPRDEAVVFVSNHQSNFDIPILMSCIEKPKAFIAKVEMENMPILSRWMSEMGCIFMDRDDVRQSLKSISKGAENVKNGYSMVIFPEGTRSVDGEIGEFKQGSLKLATKAKAKIVPVTIKGSKDIMPKGKKSIRAANVQLVISEPIDTNGISKEDEKMLSERVRGIIESNI